MGIHGRGVFTMTPEKSVMEIGGTACVVVTHDDLGADRVLIAYSSAG